jgi:hypothetical protein
MGDWEDEDWETAEVKLPVKAPAAPSTKAEQTKGEAALATAVNEPDASKFADEDAEAEPEKDYGIVKSQVSSSRNQSMNWRIEGNRRGIRVPCEIWLPPLSLVYSQRSNRRWKSTFKKRPWWTKTMCH